MNSTQAPSTPQGNSLQLALATGAFACCFAIFGSVSAMMPLIRDRLELSPFQVSVALALPVLLGSLGRIPLGMWTDRAGGRLVFSVVMVASIIPAVLMGWIDRYVWLLVVSFFLGVSLASFSVGVGFASAWYPPHRQGMALGVYGAGNIGQSLAAFGAPLMVAQFGEPWGFWTFAVLTTIWLLLFVTFSRNAPQRKPPQRLADVMRPLAEPMSWMLSLYYFLTFGGFVAMAVYLPIFLTEIFGLTPRDAGLRTAGFVLLARVVRPVGGILADRVGGQRILAWVFPATAAMSLFLASPTLATFTIGALGMAAAIGLGNGAVFKLVPDYFPHAVGSVTGLVGAAGGLGGFLPPLVVGGLREATGSFAGGFLLLGVFSLACWAVSLRTPSTAASAAQ